ncbi:SDR family NAD(P)-dependent oxidoreductase [Desertimonas flava]|uniref:SDR family NAD(P)-dependent oxidoreductase n=1 Tax=Desertimonas flava TaxID=2064846 RepID=UPI000E34E74F|nr:SDR family oxidoreductase [Desertimonas flava]
MTSQHIVIIGGTSGIGKEIAREGLRRGSTVTIAGANEDKARQVARALGPEARSGRCDLCDPASIQQFFSEIASIDHLVLTALKRDFNTLAGYQPDTSSETLLMKTVGYVAAVHHAMPALTDASSVLLFGGASAWRPVPGSTTITMANAAVLGMTRTLAIEAAPTRVNAITPGLVRGTPATDDADEIRRAVFEQLRSKLPGQRLPHVDDVVMAAFMLMDNPGINAENLVVDGGMSVI